MSRRKPGATSGGEPDGITELEKFDPDRVDGVSTPASGAPFLIIKAARGGDMDETATTPMDGGEPQPAAKDAAPGDGDGENAQPAAQDGTPATGGESAEKGGTGTPSPAPAVAQATADGEAAPQAPAPLDPTPEDLVKAASPSDREAYLGALAAHRGAEPVAKGAVTGTEYLQAKAQWRDWAAFGEREGLDGTEGGARRWLAKHGTGPVPPPSAQATVPESDVVIIPDAAMARALEDAVAKRDFDPDVGGGVDRDKIPAEDFAGKNRSFPIVTQADVSDALHSIGRAGEDNYDAATLRRNILRIARRKGFKVPKGGAEKAGGKAGAGKKCPTCKGKGKIRGGNMTCPKCKGKGTLPPKAAKAARTATAAVKATVDAGLITREAADSLIAQIRQAAKATTPGHPPLPPEVQPAGRHREPDGSYVEALEPEAGLPTDRDSTSDHIPASVAAMGKQATYEVQRMHDALCAAYSAEAVMEAYPAVKSIADAVDAEVFAKEAADLLRAGEFAASGAASAMAAVAKAFAGYPAPAIADGRALVHKSFQDMYPDTKVKPQSGIRPGSYQRPYLRAGHAAESTSQWTVNIPPASHVPEPQDYQRGYLTAGHAAPSPADHGPNNPHPPGSSGHEYYSTTEKDMAALAMRSMHDHLEANYAGMCPMAPARTVLPPQMGATGTPETKMPRAQGGVATVKAAGDAMGGTPAPGGAKRKTRGAKGMSKRKVTKMLERALRSAGTSLLGPAEVEALIAARLTPVQQHIDSQAAEMRKAIDELGSSPDPAMAPVRGPMARPGTGTAAPVEKRSLIDEAHRNAAAAAQADRMRLLEYVTKQASSPDPDTRERARAWLDANGGAGVPA